jgi:hypothetical protein
MHFNINTWASSCNLKNFLFPIILTHLEINWSNPESEFWAKANEGTQK